MPDATIIILGATGDLTRRKILPAIYKLVEEKKLTKFAVVGVARRDISIKSILHTASKFTAASKKTIWDKIARVFYYHQLDFSDQKNYYTLQNLLNKIEKKHRLFGNRLFYFATSPDYFDIISANIAHTKIASNDKQKWSKLVYEKPFGHDLPSAIKINRCLNRVFSEEMIYRIDHYLGKELVGDIALMRFTNRILEPLWCHQHIASVQIILSEKINVKDRGPYYDKYGALKDIIQNHGLQLLALTAMESPEKLSGEFIRKEKAKVLNSVKVQDVLLGQYKGYKREKGVKRTSSTETFAALKLSLNNKRWRGVPFYIKAGKALDKKTTKIHLKFKEVDCLLNQACPSDTNYFTIRIEPEDGFSLELNTKMPGKKNEVVPIKMNFCQHSRFGPNTPEAYQTLLEDAMNGDQSAFVRNDEIEASWKIIDSITKKKHKLHYYQQGSTGPAELALFEQRNKMRWKE